MKDVKWQYNELIQSGVDYTSVKEVQRYDIRMGKLRDIQGEIDILVKALSPSPESTILEIGSGTGEFAREKAKFNKVGNIEFYNAGFLTFEHAGEKFDHVYSQLALHHLPDFWKQIALNKIYTLLKSGGKFFLKDVVYPSDIEDYDTFFQKVIKEVEESVGPNYTKEYYEHISKEFSTLDWIMEKLLTDAGFIISHSSLENRLMATYVCTK